MKVNDALHGLYGQKIIFSVVWYCCIINYIYIMAGHILLFVESYIFDKELLIFDILLLYYLIKI